MLSLLWLSAGAGAVAQMPTAESVWDIASFYGNGPYAHWGGYVCAVSVAEYFQHVSLDMKCTNKHVTLIYTT